MADTKKVKILQPVGNPTQKDAEGQAVKLARGVTVELPEFLANAFIAQGVAEELSKKVKE